MLHRCVLRAALIVALALVAVPALAGLTAPTPAQAAPADAAPAAPPGIAHPISGFFVSPGTTDAENAETLRQIQEAGGDTVITFGSTLRSGSLDAKDRIRTGDELDPAFASCLIGGKPCAATMRQLGTIDQVFTFANHSHLARGALRCPQDRALSSKGQRFTLLLIPTQGTGCTSENGKYDLVAIHGGPATAADRTTSLLRAADQAGVTAYIGMPSVQKRADVPWLPDLSYQHTFAQFTDRFLREHKSRGTTAALAGFYHHTEMPVAGDPDVWQPVLDLYRLQNQAIARVFPGKSALVSPYLDNRRSANEGLSADQLASRTQAGARAIAQTASGVPLTVALQDGMGTGKGGAFHINQATAPVDGPAAKLVGGGTWGQNYLLSVSESFSAARAGLEGTGATLWANVEGMTPQDTPGAQGCGTGERGQTTKNRLDQQVQAVGRFTAKNISFMWDPFYTCQVGGAMLADALTTHGSAPVVTNAALAPDRNVLWLAGYNLAGSSVRVKYVDTRGKVHQATSPVSVFSDDYGQRTGLDAGLESADYQVHLAAPQEGKIFIVWVTGQDGTPSSRNFSLRH
ncbi:hypothetical protein [Ornithinimicrobium faecis]|uniref:hypothetical protein n=1 Tax=Ornithinimicrobium faecis TaxID=2934158 RepID=UPI0021177158|nr:hypothetical protein [Ornithinimicrobium sp. HY1745]